MTRLAAEFGLSDVALHKICRKHDVPTPPVGYWAKKARGKPVSTVPLPASGHDGDLCVLIGEGASAKESGAVSEARARAWSSAERMGESAPGDDAHPIVEETTSKLAKSKPDKAGIVHTQGKRSVCISIRPATLDRASIVLRSLAAAGKAAGFRLEAGQDSAVWIAEGETVSFEIVEMPDRIEHMPTEAELRAVAKWEKEREERRRRYGYASDWGRPHIPKWEEHYRGRIVVRLEEVRIHSEQSCWGPVIPRTFADNKTRDILKAMPKIVAAIAAIAVAKRENREIDERRRLAAEEARRRREEAERRAALERQRSTFLEGVLGEHARLRRLEAYLADFPAEPGPRGVRFRCWLEERAGRMRKRLSTSTLESRLEGDRLLDEET